MIKCKACSASVIVSENQIDEMLNIIISGNQFKLISEDSYKKRLDICFNCKSLEYGTTCLQCGCIVQIRARLLESTCPYPQQSKWD